MEIHEYDIDKKIRNLNIISSGVVLSTKYFPVFLEDGKERIFKPLSKTKPYQTPLFAYSEVYWSYFINKYIDSQTPIYSLATCKNLSKEQNKYYEKGCIVDNILNENEELINLLELFRKYPDYQVDIDDYINYCEVQYDYEKVLRSTFFTINRDLGEELAKQILCSILRRDENYHYENVSFIQENGKIKKIAPMMDMEYSQMFMHPDEIEKHRKRFSLYDEGMGVIFSYNCDLDFNDNYFEFLSKLYGDCIYDKYDEYKFYNLKNNIKTITELYPNMCKDFLKRLESMRKEVETTEITLSDEFLGTFSSLDWIPTRMILKEGKTKDSEEYKYALKEAINNRIKINTTEFNKRLRKEVLWSIDKLTYMINIYLDIEDSKVSVITEYNNKTLYDKVKRKSHQELEMIDKFLKELRKEEYNKNTRKS